MRPNHALIRTRRGRCFFVRASVAARRPPDTLVLADLQVATAKVSSNRRPLALAVVALACTGAAWAADPGFGELPPGSISTSETHGVAAEICRDHLFDPAVAKARLPAGFRLISAAEAASSDRAIDALLQANPKLRRYALGTLCFMSVGQFVVDDWPVGGANPSPVAFWWASAQGPRDANMRGKTSWVQLGSWYSLGSPSRPAVLRMDPMAEFVDIEIEQVEPNRWRIRLALPSETVAAEVTSSGSRVPSRAAQPGYMSVPMSGRAAGHFSVFTFFGHHHQAAQGRWQALGTGVFSDAFAIAGEADAFSTVFQDGWTSRAGLYRFSNP